MPGEFITLSRQDERCREYLLGRIEPQIQALPVKSFAVDSSREKVTFQVLPMNQLLRPPLWVVLAQAFRLNELNLTWAPLAVVAAWLWAQGTDFSGLVLALALLALSGVQGGIFLLNDFYDHMRGLDRLSSRRGSQVIQRGWLRAWQARLWAWGMLGLGGSLGLLALGLASPPGGFLPLALLVSFALIAGLILAWAPRRLRRWALPDLFIFLSLGPALTLGLALLLGGEGGQEVLALGAVFGLLALLSFHLRGLESLKAEHSWLGRLGFDRSHRLLLWELRLFPLLSFALLWFWGTPLWAWGASPLLALGCWGLLLPDLQVGRSPWSSSLRQLGAKTLALHGALGAWLMILSLYGFR